MLLADARDLRNGEALVNRAVPFPENHLRVEHLLDGLAAVHLVRIPHDHLVERNPHLVRGVAAEMLIGQEQDALAAFPRPAQRRGAVGRSTDDTAALAHERLDRRR
jgi:hypothetical protein